MKFFKQDESGSVREWWAEIEGSRYRLCSGLVGGKTVFSEWTQCEAKNRGKVNQLDARQQAEAEVKAHCTKKLKKGYTQDIKKVSEKKSSLISPMLAEEYEESRVRFPVYAQPKLDGIRCIAREDGLWSRKGEKIVSVPHIENIAVYLCKKHRIVLDGELYNHGLKDDFNKICSLVRRQKIDKEHQVQIRSLVEYHVYDLIDERLLFNQRLSKMRFSLGPHVEIKLVPTSLKTSQKDLDELYEVYLENGYEGQMIRNDAFYKRKRTYNLLKRKEFQDEEFSIAGIVEGKGNRSGMVGACTFVLPDGKLFQAALMGTNEYRKKVWKNWSNYIGLKATVKYFRKTPDGIPRFPVVKHIHEEN